MSFFFVVYRMRVDGDDRLFEEGGSINLIYMLPLPRPPTRAKPPKPRAIDRSSQPDP